MSNEGAGPRLRPFVMPPRPGWPACVHRAVTARRYAPADMTAGRPGWPMPGRRCRATQEDRSEGTRRAHRRPGHRAHHDRGRAALAAPARRDPGPGHSRHREPAPWLRLHRRRPGGRSASTPATPARSRSTGGIPAAATAAPGATARSAGERAGASSASGISASYATDAPFSITVHNFFYAARPVSAASAAGMRPECRKRRSSLSRSRQGPARQICG